LAQAERNGPNKSIIIRNLFADWQENMNTSSFFSIICLLGTFTHGLKRSRASFKHSENSACEHFQQHVSPPEEKEGTFNFKVRSAEGTSLDWIGDEGGKWSACTHLQKYGFNWSPGLARYLTSLKPKTALEFGSGTGFHASYLAGHADTAVTCIEPDAALGKLNLENHLGGLSGSHGVIKPLALNIFSENSTAKQCVQDIITQTYDVVMTFEVAEHIPSKFHDDLVNFLVKSTGKWLFFSAARPKQKGTGHIEESMKPFQEWRDVFKKAGLVYMPDMTRVAQGSAYFMRSYDLAKNLMVFKNPAYKPDSTVNAVPVELLNYEWGGGGYSGLKCPDNVSCTWLQKEQGEKGHPITDVQFQHNMDITKDARNAAIKEGGEEWPVVAKLLKDIKTGKSDCNNEGNLH